LVVDVLTDPEFVDSEPFPELATVIPPPGSEIDGPADMLVFAVVEIFPTLSASPVFIVAEPL